MPGCEDSCHSAEIVVQNLLLMKFIDPNQDHMDSMNVLGSVHSYVLLYMYPLTTRASSKWNHTHCTSCGYNNASTSVSVMYKIEDNILSIALNV